MIEKRQKIPGDNEERHHGHRTRQKQRPVGRAGQPGNSDKGDRAQAACQHGETDGQCPKPPAAEEEFLRYPGTWRGLAGITTPTLLTNGELDRGVPPVNARRMHARIPGSSLSIYKDAAHGMLFQDAERFAAQVAAFGAR